MRREGQGLNKFYYFVWENTYKEIDLYFRSEV